MALSKAHGTSSVSLSARAGQAIDGLLASFARRRVYSVTLRELSALSDRELSDLGLSRTDLRRVAYEAAYLN